MLAGCALVALKGFIRAVIDAGKLFILLIFSMDVVAFARTHSLLPISHVAAVATLCAIQIVFLEISGRSQLAREDARIVCDQ